MTSAKVVVIGGGYAGAMAVNALQAAPDISITLVNPRAKFVERVRLHQLAADTDDAVEDFAELLGERIELVVDSVTGIDRDARQIDLESGQKLDYDYLIYAVGSTGSIPRGVPGANEFSYPLSEWEQAERLRLKLIETPAAAPVVIVGGGLTGIEMAGELAELGRNVTMVTDILGPSLGPGARRAVGKALAKLGVTVHASLDAAVTEITEDAVVLADGRRITSVVTMWTAGLGVPGLAATSGLSTDAMGRLLADETLTSVDDERIVGAGDAVSPSGVPLRMSCQAAGPLGAQAANTVLARIAGNEPAEIRQGFVAQCLSVGRTLGVIQLVHTNDSPRRFHIAGKPAAFVKERVCQMTMSHLRHEAHKPGSFGWLKANGWRKAELAAVTESGRTP